jgi:hypothetical protein
LTDGFPIKPRQHPLSLPISYSTGSKCPKLQKLRRDGDKPGSLVFSEPKNASRRTIDLPQRALEALRSHRRHQLEEKLRASSYEDSDLVFATGKGTPLDAQNIVNRHFELLKRAGLPLSAGTISGTRARPCS